MNSLLPGGHSQRSQARQRVQHHLPMAMQTPFGCPWWRSCRTLWLLCSRRSRGIRNPRTGIQQLFILDGELERSFGFSALSVRSTNFFTVLMRSSRFPAGQEIAVHQKDIIFGVINV